MPYKIRANLTGFDSLFYVNVAWFHLPKPQSILTENLDELPIVKVELP